MKKFITTLTIFVALGLGITGLIVTDVIQFTPKKTKTTITKIPKIERPSPPSYFEHISKGDEYAEKNLYTLAFSEYILANKANPDSTEPLFKIGKLHLRRKDAEKAREVFQQILAKDTNNLSANIYLARVYIMSGKTDKALEILNTLQEKNQLISYYKGLIYAVSGEYEGSKQALREAVEINTDTAITDYANKFLKNYEIFASTQGGQIIYLKTLLAKTLNQADEYTLAIPLLYDVLKEKKDYRDAWILLGYAYLNTEDGKNALEALKEAKKLDEHKPETLFFLGLAYQLEGNKKEAINAMEESLRKGYEPKIQVKQKLADLYMETGEFEKAAQKYNEVIDLNSEDLSYFVRPMWLYADKLKNPQKARELAEKALKIHPDKAMSFNLLGWALIASKDYEGAKENLSKALKIDPKLSAAYLNFGKLFEEINYTGTAKDYYKTAFETGKGTSIGDSAAERYNVLVQKEKTQFQANTLQKNN